ncbi:MAG TPA: discoidin domain-containing protein [Planctomycetota bacterium]|jgi:hypothetical protein
MRPGRTLKYSGLLCATVLLSTPASLLAAFAPEKPNAINFTPEEARFVRFVINASSQGEPCIDELEIYAQDGTENLALASTGAKATASSCLAGHAIHQIANLNDGQYGNSHSWIAASSGKEWAQIELPKAAKIAKVVFSRDREGKFRDRMPTACEVMLSTDGQKWKTVARVGDAAPAVSALPAGPLSEEDLIKYAFATEARMLQKSGVSDPLEHALKQYEDMLERFAAMSIDLSPIERDRPNCLRMQYRLAQKESNHDEIERLLGVARKDKRELFFREPSLKDLQKILVVKRQPFRPSHNYSDLLDSTGAPGGSICILETPFHSRLQPSRAKLITLFETKDGVVRDPMASFDGKRIYFAYKKTKQDYYHLMSVNADGSDLKQLTDEPFHDFYPCPLPDGGLAFMTTRCHARFLCWRPQAFVLFRMDADGKNMKPLSYANLSEWGPSVMNDGRIIWTRSEYIDKGSDFGHTLWAIRPDGTHPELIFGNNTRYCYMNGREVPGTRELLCTLISHGGDLNGPVGLIDLDKRQLGEAAVKNITPDSKQRFHMDWAQRECFRDPVPISRDYYLCSHAPEDRFGIYVIDRYGNREALYLDTSIGSMAPQPLKAVKTPPVLGGLPDASQASGLKPQASDDGELFVSDVYQGLEPAVKRGSVKYLRVCEEVRAELLQLPSGEYQQDHPAFEDWYATPTHKVKGPFGWPSYVAKSDLGIVPVEEDGSASLRVPAGKVIYFEALDEKFNELQRMRSVLQLQPGEKRGCIGCHENRSSAPPTHSAMAFRREPSKLQPPSWGGVPFSYEKIVQPVLDAQCVRCHDANDKNKLNLTSARDKEKVPASYRTLIERGWVNYFDMTWGREHNKAAPLSFGTVKSKLLPFIEAPHYDVKLTPEDQQRIKCWIDLNCPLWPDYVYRPLR